MYFLLLIPPAALPNLDDSFPTEFKKLFSINFLGTLKSLGKPLTKPLRNPIPPNIA